MIYLLHYIGTFTSLFTWHNQSAVFSSSDVYSNILDREKNSDSKYWAKQRHRWIRMHLTNNWGTKGLRGIFVLDSLSIVCGELDFFKHRYFSMIKEYFVPTISNISKAVTVIPTLHFLRNLRMGPKKLECYITVR